MLVEKVVLGVLMHEAAMKGTGQEQVRDTLRGPSTPHSAIMHVRVRVCMHETISIRLFSIDRRLSILVVINHKH